MYSQKEKTDFEVYGHFLPITKIKETAGCLLSRRV